MAASCATVSFQGSAPCIEHGKTGWTVENGNISAFADGIIKLLDEPGFAEELGRNARDAVLANYTWDIAAERCEVLYRRMLGQDAQLEGAA
jgi:rhamnosyl/mannosyltransferase